MFLVLLVIASAVAAPLPQHGGRQAEASHFYRQPSRGDVIKRIQQPARINPHENTNHRRQFVNDQELPLYEDDVSAVKYQPAVAVRTIHQRPRKFYDNEEQRYRNRAPVQRIRQSAQHIPEAASFRSRGDNTIQSERLPIERSINADHALDAEGSSFISDVEEDAYEDEDDDVYEEHPAVESEERIGVVEAPILVTGGIGGAVGGGVGVGIGGGQSYGHSHGQKEGHGHHHSDHHAKGQKGGEGHKAEENYQKGHVEKHGHEHNNGEKKEAFGVKKGHLDEHKGYHKGNTHHKEAKGADKFHSRAHKKGKKTSGSRNLHHKDEFEKNEVFFDEEHDTGHEKLNTHEEGGHQEAKGGASKKGHLNSGYKNAVKGEEGEREEGHKYGNSKGHAGHVGHKAEEGHGEGFHKAGGHKGQEAHGHFYKKAGGGATIG